MIDMRNAVRRISKNVVILFLLVSLVVLTIATWFGDIQPGNAQRRQVIGELFGWSGDKDGDVYPGYEEYDYTMSIFSPVRAAVRGEGELTYLTARSEARELFERVSAVLAGAMDTANTRRELTAYQWRGVLSGTMVLFDFEGEMPLDMLSAVLGASDYGPLERQARYAALCVDRDALTFVIKAENGVPAAYQTALHSAELASLIREYGEGNAQFAFEDRVYSRHLPDEFVVLDNRPKPAVIKMSSTFTDYTSTSSERVINAVLESFGYNPYTTGGYIESDDTRVYVEELRTLRVSPDGALSYYAPEPEAVTPSAPDAEARLAIISNATSMLDRVTSNYMGDGAEGVSIYIMRAYYNASSGRYIVLFGCEVDGIVLSFQDGYFARFEYAGTELAGAHLTVASYYPTAQYDEPMPDAQAAASVTGKSRLFELRYVKKQNDEYHADWYYLE